MGDCCSKHGGVVTKIRNRKNRKITSTELTEKIRYRHQRTSASDRAIGQRRASIPATKYDIDDLYLHVESADSLENKSGRFERRSKRRVSIASDELNLTHEFSENEIPTTPSNSSADNENFTPKSILKSEQAVGLPKKKKDKKTLDAYDLVI